MRLFAWHENPNADAWPAKHSFLESIPVYLTCLTTYIFSGIFLLHPPALQSPTAFCFACLLCLKFQHQNILCWVWDPQILLSSFWFTCRRRVRGICVWQGPPNSRMWVSNGLGAKVSVEFAHCITGIHLIRINFCPVINYLTGKNVLGINWVMFSALTVQHPNTFRMNNSTILARSAPEDDARASLHGFSEHFLGQQVRASCKLWQAMFRVPFDFGDDVQRANSGRIYFRNHFREKFSIVIALFSDFGRACRPSYGLRAIQHFDQTSRTKSQKLQCFDQVSHNNPGNSSISDQVSHSPRISSTLIR